MIHGHVPVTRLDGSMMDAADVGLQVTRDVSVLGADGAMQVMTQPVIGQPDPVMGSDEADTLVGSRGNDQIQAGAGDDFVFDDAGNDLIEAGDGNDVVYAGADNDILDLGVGNDTAFAGAGNDIVLGSAGQDALIGEDGHDILFGGDGNDLLVGGSGGDVLSGDAGDDELYGGADADALFAGDGNDQLYGQEGNDLLRGDAGNDILDGGTGADTLDGGSGDDLYVVDAAGDVVIEAAGAGIDTVIAAVDGYVLGDDLENLTLDTGTVSGRGNALDNRLVGNSKDNRLEAVAGNDWLDGGLGADTMIGGQGDDAYRVDHAGDLVVEQAGQGQDVVRSSVDYRLPDAVEDLVLVGRAPLTGAGNALANRLVANDAGNVLRGEAGDDTLLGGSGADRLLGGLGADQMQGSAGDDLYEVDDVLDGVVELANQGHDQVLASIDYTLGADVEDLVLIAGARRAMGNALDNRLVANDAGNELSGFGGDDTLLGGAGDDHLDGGAGADVMQGRGGDDTYEVNDVGDQVVEVPGGGIDTVHSLLDYTLGDSVERLILAGSARRGLGNSLDNVLVANDAGNQLLGAGGQDTLRGGAGNDRLDGGIDADLLAGGAGDDLYWVDNAGDRVDESFGAGIDSVQASVDYALDANVENLTLVGTARRGTGNALDNVLVANNLGDVLSGGVGADTLLGGVGNDVLDGGAGVDVMRGGAGNDTYRVDHAADQTLEAPQGGVDEVIASVDWTLSETIENLTLNGSARRGVGNALDNRLVANDLGDSLWGGEGRDTLLGGAGDDQLDGGSGADVLQGGAGNDSLRWSVDALYGAATCGPRQMTRSLDQFDGGDGIDTLFGTSGDDRILLDDFGGGLAGGAATPRLVSIERILAGDGDDVVDLGGCRFTAGDTVIDGGAGNDLLQAGAGHEALLGGAGDDILVAGGGSHLLAGGQGNDQLQVGDGVHVVAFKRGDGADTLVASAGSRTVISLGSGIAQGDLRLRRQGQNLTLEMGQGDSLTLCDWYRPHVSFGITTLQLVDTPQMPQGVQVYDFDRLVRRAEADHAVRHGASPNGRWTLTNSLYASFQQSRSGAALGGDLAWQVAHTGTLDGLSLGVAQAALGQSGFGRELQSLQRPASSLGVTDLRVAA